MSFLSVLKKSSVSSVLAALSWAVVLSNAHAAGDGVLQEQIQLEDQIQARVVSIVRPFDPLVQAKVTLTLKEVAVPLPGTGLGQTRMIPLDVSGALAQNSIEEVRVAVETRQSPPPKWLEAKIRDAISIPGTKISFVFSAVPTEAVVAYERALDDQVRRNLGAPPSKRDPAATAQPSEPEPIRMPPAEADPKLLSVLAGMLGALVVFGFLGLALNRANHRSLARLMEEKLIPAMEQASQSRPSLPMGNAGGGGGADRALPSPAAAMDASAGGEDFQELPLAGVLALLSDCYWCEEDAYAHYVWTRLPVERRLEVMDKSQLDANYFRHFRGFTPSNLGFHLDPYFLKPLSLNHLSQSDLGEWLKKHPEAATVLSPLRLRSLPLKLEDRLQYVVNANEGGKPNARSAKFSFPDRASELRKLGAQLDVHQLTGEDELYVFKHAKDVPASNRASIQTLAWLALRSLNYRKDILGKVDARELAGSWSGPKEVLAKLKEAIPEAKWKLLESYIESTVPDRNSDTFRYLVAAGLDGADQEEKDAKAGAKDKRAAA